MANLFTFDSATGPYSLEVSRTGNMIRFCVWDERWGERAVCLDRGMDLREMLWLLQVTPEMLRGLVDEMWPENEEAVS